MHQERVAKERGRPVENKWIGQRIDEPDIDIAVMARAQGARRHRPGERAVAIEVRASRRPSQQVKNGAVCVVDVRVMPGYDANMGGSRDAGTRRR